MLKPVPTATGDSFGGSTRLHSTKRSTTNAARPRSLQLKSTLYARTVAENIPEA